VDDRRQPRLEVPHVGAVVADELARVGDAPLDEPVDHQALLLGGEDRPRLRAVERLDAAVEEGDVLEWRRQLPLQARLLDHFLDLAELVDDRDLALVDDEERR
jgi:hypothetical protein